MRRIAPPAGVPRLYDIVVVGAGIAGLAFTLRLPEETRVALLTKGALGESNTRYAQGGLAAAVGLGDSPALHEADTLAAGAGLCDPAAVRRLVERGPAAVAWLLELGTRFDRASAADSTKPGALLLGREAAHSLPRVLHAGGDATGAEIERALVAGVRSRPNVDIFEHAVALDLILGAGRCQGVAVQLAPEEAAVWLAAPVTTLANGGAGRLWATTSNPSGATADGLAMGLRAGVAVADLEFTQFHPTVLALPHSEPFLISEAVRGEGAYLRGADGARFMVDAHPLAELAPRDVVARALQAQIGANGRGVVSLDLRHLDPAQTHARFPTIARELASRGLDLARDLIPVAPAAHYFMGGLVAGIDGRTSLPGLIALGEVACTGVHGANRLASNSLLEGLVFGLDAAASLPPQRAWTPIPVSGDSSGSAPKTEPPRDDVAQLKRRLQLLMSRKVAVVRDHDGLVEASRELRLFALELIKSTPGGGDRDSIELRNMLLAASAIIEAARRREESRGAHFRADFPMTNPTLDGQHLIFGGPGASWRFGALAAAIAPDG
ncbi:MAG: L-aspartate oxidase [Chloroflexia bacterium]|nr:L-aspartate oxidase [Chloroflexia bacterium]